MARTTSPSPSGTASFFLIVLAQVQVSLCGTAPVQRHRHTSFLASHGAPAVEPACAALANKGTHFTVDLEVGTPGQKFSVVADTGSNALIVPDCVCNAMGYCDKKGRCFRGTNRSSTFALSKQPSGAPIGIMITFGSGTIQAVIANETVRIGSLAVEMTDGILLMTQHALRFPGPFEGILGLGVPQPKESHVLHKDKKTSQARRSGGGGSQGSGNPAVDSIVGDIMKRIFGNGARGYQNSGTPEQPMYIGVELESGSLDQGAPARHKAPTYGGPESDYVAPHQPAGFLEQANVPRFSMCFNDGADGVLRMGTAVDEKHALETVGKMHWAVDFRGVTIGHTSAQLDLKICSPANMTKGQKTPCGAIPDSGTTNIMLPQDHLSLVLEAICDGWTRCRDNHTALVEAAVAAKAEAVRIYGWDPFGIASSPKSEVLELLLADCDAWLNESETSGLAELPPVHLHVAGKNGKKNTLALTSRAYITMAEREEMHYVYKELEGIGKIPVGMNKTGVKKMICTPAFSPMDYLTQENGPVWIVGTPLFYEFVVGFDMTASPPAVSFTHQSQMPCGSCDKKAGLVSTSSGSRSASWPRQVDGPDRLPSIDLSEPL